MRIAFALASVLLAASCGDSGEAGTIEGTSWTLVALDGEEPLSDVSVTASFAEGRVSGSAGCNPYMGGYTIDGPGLSVEPLAATRMACPPPVMEQESAFLAALEAATSYSVVGDTLEIAYPDGTLTFSG